MTKDDDNNHKPRARPALEAAAAVSKKEEDEDEASQAPDKDRVEANSSKNNNTTRVNKQKQNDSNDVSANKSRDCENEEIERNFKSSALDKSTYLSAREQALTEQHDHQQQQSACGKMTTANKANTTTPSTTTTSPSRCDTVQDDKTADGSAQDDDNYANEYRERDNDNEDQHRQLSPSSASNVDANCSATSACDEQASVDHSDGNDHRNKQLQQKRPRFKHHHNKRHQASASNRKPYQQQQYHNHHHHHLMLNQANTAIDNSHASHSSQLAADTAATSAQNDQASASYNQSSSSSSGPMISADYLAQLIKDRKQLSNLPPAIFMHVPRLIDDEINEVRQSLFQLNDVVHLSQQPIELPEAEGEYVQLQEKLYVPIDEHPEYNFVGRLLGPRGMTAKQLEQETGCKIMIRGRGSMRDKKKEEQNRGKTNWEHLNDDLHVLITVEDTQNRAEIKLKRAIEEVKQLLVPIVDGEDELKKRQLMELAIINGTYRDCNYNEALNKILSDAMVQQQHQRQTSVDMQLVDGQQHHLQQQQHLLINQMESANDQLNQQQQQQQQHQQQDQSQTVDDSNQSSSGVGQVQQGRQLAPNTQNGSASISSGIPSSGSNTPNSVQLGGSNAGAQLHQHQQQQHHHHQQKQHVHQGQMAQMHHAHPHHAGMRLHHPAHHLHQQHPSLSHHMPGPVQAGPAVAAAAAGQLMGHHHHMHHPNHPHQSPVGAAAAAAAAAALMASPTAAAAAEAQAAGALLYAQQYHDFQQYYAAMAAAAAAAAAAASHHQPAGPTAGARLPVPGPHSGAHAPHHHHH